MEKANLPTGTCSKCGKPWDDHLGWEHWPLLICSKKDEVRDATRR